MAEHERRRRRLRHSPATKPATEPTTEPATRAYVETAPVHDPGPQPGERPSVDDREAERGLRGLVGAGSSQVSRFAALRARDAARPSDADLAAAEAELVIIRRGWVPRESLNR